MKNKRIFAMMMVVVMMAASLVACGPKQSADSGSAGNSENAKKIGVFFYQFNDPYLSTVRNAMQKLDDEDPNVEFIFQDGQNDQGKQNDEIDALIDNVDVLLINLVDTGAAQTVLEKVKSSGKPTILFNREPDDINAYKIYDKARFVGTKKEEAGVLQGNLILDYWKNTPNADRNGNGKLDYVLLHGGLDNAEANARSEYAVKTIKDGGVDVNEIGMQIANWSDEKAKQAMDAWLGKDEKNIDVVIANNDSMAIGAINALKALGYNTGEEGAPMVAVFGVDATEEAKEAIARNTMTGTVMQDADAMAEAMYKLTQNALADKDYLDGTDYQWDESGIAVRIPYRAFEVDNK